MNKTFLKNIFNKKKKAHVAVYLFVAIGLIIGACTGITCQIKEQPTTMTAGDSAHFKLFLQWQLTNNDHSDKLVVGMCVPKSWNAAENTTMSVLCSVGSSSPEGMSPMPETNIDPSNGKPWAESFRLKFGIGPNYIDQLEWVIFVSDNIYNVPNQSSPFGDVFISIKTSADNLQFKPGFAFCEDLDGLSDAFTYFYGNTWGTCLNTIGEGELQDFCNPAVGFAEPSTSTKNDLLTFKYDANIDTLPLKDEDEVYLCTIAYTNDGQVINKCIQEPSTKLVLWDYKKWRIDIWPDKYFGLAPNQELTRLEYYFTDKTGTVRVGFADSDVAFRYTFKCN